MPSIVLGLEIRRGGRRLAQVESLADAGPIAPVTLKPDIPQGLMGVNLPSNKMDIIALIGRDLLEAAIPIYNGMDGHFSVST